ncbi:GerAB/ArcD/ProY family transporter [Paenibacillus sp. JTLBN-2024]
MAQTEKKISARQLFLFIIQAQIGVGVLSIPYKLNETARGGAGITVLITGAITQLIILMFWLLLRKFPGLNLFQICLRLGGRVFGKLLIAGYIGYFVLLGANIMLSAVGVLQRWMMNATPTWILLGLFSIMTYYLAKEKLTVMARFYTLSSALFIPLIIFVSYGLTQARLEYMFPLMEAGIWNILKATKDTTISMYGFEVILVIFPFIDASDKKEADDHKHVEFVRHVVLCFRGLHLSHGVQLRAASLDSRARSLSGQIAEFLHRRPGGRLVPSHLVDYPRLLDHELCVCRFRGACAIVRAKSHGVFTPYVNAVIFFITLLPATPLATRRLDVSAEYAAYLFIFILPFAMVFGSKLFKKKVERSA